MASHFIPCYSAINTMFCRSTYLYLFLSIYVSWFGGGINFRLMYKGNRLKIYKSISALRKFYFLTNKLVNLLYVIFVAFRMIGLLTAQEQAFYFIGTDTIPRLSLLVQTSYVLIGYTVTIVQDVPTLLKQDDISSFIFQYIKLFPKIQNDFKTKFPHILKPANLVTCKSFLTTMFLVGHLIYLQNFLFMIIKPWTLHFFLSLAKNCEAAMCLYTRVSLIILQCWIWWNFWANLYFYIFSIYIYICSSIHLLRQIK